MTTLTEVPLDQHATDLEAWLNYEIEKLCELYPYYGDTQCRKPASWIMYFLLPCNCFKTRSIFLCDSCREFVQNIPARCRMCKGPIEVRWIERSR